MKSRFREKMKEQTAFGHNRMGVGCISGLSSKMRPISTKRKTALGRIARLDGCEKAANHNGPPEFRFTNWVTLGCLPLFRTGFLRSVVQLQSRAQYTG